MNVLAINCGSSSIKFGLFAPAGGQQARAVSRLAGGRVEKLGGEKTELHFETEGGKPLETTAAVRDHTAGVQRIAEWLGAMQLVVHAVGHRVVHGGPRFRTPTVLDDGVIAAIHELEALAPLHNGPSLAGINACRAALGGDVPMVAVFDTAFHAYAAGARLALRHPAGARRPSGIRRFGFHGSPTVPCSSAIAPSRAPPSRAGDDHRPAPRERLLGGGDRERPLGRHVDGTDAARRARDGHADPATSIRRSSSISRGSRASRPPTWSAG